MPPIISKTSISNLFSNLSLSPDREASEPEGTPPASRPNAGSNLLPEGTRQNPLRRVAHSLAHVPSRSLRNLRGLFNAEENAPSEVRVPAVAANTPNQATLEPLRPTSPTFDMSAFEVRPSTSRTDIVLDCVIPDSSAHAAAHDLARFVLSDDQISEVMLKPAGNSTAIAKLVQTKLIDEDCTTKARSVLMWKNSGDVHPSNHIVIVARIAGENYVIDPTAEQFGERPMFVPETEWKQRIARARPGYAMVYGDYPNVTRAASQAGDYYHGNVHSFSGGTIMHEPDWYAGIRAAGARPT